MNISPLDAELGELQLWREARGLRLRLRIQDASYLRSLSDHGESDATDWLMCPAVSHWSLV